LRFLMLKSKKRPGAVVYYCNHGYTAGRHWEDHSSRPACAKSERQSVSINELDTMACICGPSSVGGYRWGLWFEGGFRQKLETLPKK
jgi:hypothetical protein